MNRIIKRFLFFAGTMTMLLGMAVPVCVAGSQIPSSAKVWNGHSYYLYEKTMTFADAEAFCESLGGHLATISSKKENTMLTEYLKAKKCGAAMIGLYDEAGSEGKWDTWVTGEKVRYSNWGAGQPDWTGQKICVLNTVASSTYRWEVGEWDNGWDGDYCYLCEWDTATRFSIANASIKLYKEKYTYNGKEKKPSAKVTLTVNGKKTQLKKGTDYTLSYGANKDPGVATVRIEGKGAYFGTADATFEIVPRVPTKLSVKKNKSKEIVVKWKKRSEAEYYEIEYSTSKKFQDSHSVTTAGSGMTFEQAQNLTGQKTESYTLTGLKEKTKYYIRVRSWRNGQHSKWTTKKSVKS